MAPLSTAPRGNQSIDRRLTLPSMAIIPKDSGHSSAFAGFCPTHPPLYSLVFGSREFLALWGSFWSQFWLAKLLKVAEFAQPIKESSIKHVHAQALDSQPSSPMAPHNTQSSLPLSILDIHHISPTPEFNKPLNLTWTRTCNEFWGTESCCSRGQRLARCPLLGQ